MSGPTNAFLNANETTNEALARLGFRHEKRRGIGGDIVRVSDECTVTYVRNVEATNRWIYAGCPDCDGESMRPDLDHSASDFEVAS